METGRLSDLVEKYGFGIIVEWCDFREEGRKFLITDYHYSAGKSEPDGFKMDCLTENYSNWFLLHTNVILISVPNGGKAKPSELLELFRAKA